MPAIIYGAGATGCGGRCGGVLGVEGLAGRTPTSPAAIPRLSISVAALAVSLSMMVAIAVMIGSFRETVVYWVGQTLQADLFVGPGLAAHGRLGADAFSGRDRARVARIRRSRPWIAFRNLDLAYGGNLASCWAPATFERRRCRAAPCCSRAPADGARARCAAPSASDAVIVSEAFANKYGAARRRHASTLRHAAGPRPFAIVAVYYDYSSRSRRDHDGPRHVRAATSATGRRPALTVYLKARRRSPSGSAQEMLDSLDRGQHAPSSTPTASLRQEVLRIFDSTFAITYALEIIAIVVAMLGVAGTLLTLVLERRRELTMLRLIGADRRQVRRMVVIEAALIGAVSQAIGLGVGLALSLVLIYVINVQSFGWTIQFRLPVAFLLQASAAVVLATSLAGIYPAHRAAALVVEREE